VLYYCQARVWRSYGKKLIIDKGLYSLKSSGSKIPWAYLSNNLRKIGYLPSKADSDFWIKLCSDDHNEYLPVESSDAWWTMRQRKIDVSFFLPVESIRKYSVSWEKLTLSKTPEKQFLMLYHVN
jgi:hypothetical protein